MNILINTFTTYNLGQRLQNYALQKILLRYGNVYTLLHREWEDKKLLQKRCIKTKKIIKDIFRPLFKYYSYKNIHDFKKFNKNILWENNIKFYEKEKLEAKYDYFVCGSDQIWNSQLWDIKLGLMPNISKHKIAYGASVGNTELSLRDKYLFEKYLNRFQSISVREKEAEALLQPLTYKNVQTVLDPTLLLSATDWQQVECKPQYVQDEDYLFVYTLGSRSNSDNCNIANIALKYNLKVIDLSHLRGTKIHVGPAEFIYLVRNAKLVLTTSFHATVFSIIFDKPFVLLNPDEKIGSRASRMKNLERIFKTTFPNLKEIDISNEQKLFGFSIQNKQELLRIEQKKSLQFLDDAFKEHKQQNNLYDYAFDCAGCGLCASICPKGAISYKQNIEGFIRPVIDEAKCVHCGLCSKKCVQLQTYQQQQLPQGIMFAKRKEPKDDASSSAGVFGAMATHILNQGGVVYAVKYNPDQTHFVRVTNLQELEEVKGSKYLQADITKSYEDISKDVTSGKPTLVCGTPCQIAGLKQKFGDAENLYLIKLLCHSVPSQKLLRDYCEEVYKDVPEKINFRKKNPVWGKSVCQLTFKNGDVKIDKNLLNILLSDFSMNDCCYNCHFGGKQVGADITIGDAWGVERIDKTMFSPHGVSIVIPHTNRGIDIFNNCQKQFEIYKIPYSKYKYLNKNVLESFKFQKKIHLKEQFLNNLELNGVLKNANLINQKQNPFIKKVIRKIKHLLKR